MNKKICTMFFLIFLVTGCDANYTIEIKEGKIKETLYVNELNMTKALERDDMEMSFKDYALEYGKTNTYYTNYYNMYTDEGNVCKKSKDNECNVYDKEFIDKENEIGFILSSDFTIDEYKNASIPNDMIPGFSSTFDGKYLTLTGGSNWNFIKGYKNLDNLKITIKTNYAVKSTNTKYRGNGVYEFDVTKSNNIDRDQLYIILDTTVTKRYSKKLPTLAYYIIFTLLITLFIGLGMFLYNKYNKNNKI